MLCPRINSTSLSISTVDFGSYLQIQTPKQMTSPDFSLKSIPKELDEDGWEIEYDNNHIQVYSKFNIFNSNILGFKTITEHAVAVDVVFELLKDVCGAMHQINNRFLTGEIFDNWLTESGLEGKIVRTSFQMPFPLSNREFLHGLHAKQENEQTFVVAYTPIESSEIPVQANFVRCPMNISGQRITLLESGLVRVEHLMIYHLGGAISSKIQDNWLKKANIGAYLKEWKNLGTKLFPPNLTDINHQQLTILANHTLRISESWSTTGKPKHGTVKVGHVSYFAPAVFRLDLEVDAGIEQVVNVLADESLKYLPLWNDEYLDGSVMTTLEDTPTKSAWLIRVHYKTPFFLANREYIYYFSREWISKDEVLILYNSVQHDSEIPKGFVRALLYPSIHRCLRLENGKTKIEHILATDLKGKLGPLQNSLLKGSLAQAQCRDMEKQQKLFRNL